MRSNDPLELSVELDAGLARIQQLEAALKLTLEALRSSAGPEEIKRKARWTICSQKGDMMKWTSSQRANLLDELCTLCAVGKHDVSSNYCAHDGIYAHSIERRWGASIEDLSKSVGFDKMLKQYLKAKKDAAKVFK